MSFSKFPTGTVIEISVESPQMFSIKDIKRYIELDEKICRNRQERREWIGLRRSFARAFNCSECFIEVEDDTLFITLP